MDHARRFGLVAVIGLFLLAVVVAAPPPRPTPLSLAADVGWPPSADLLVAEVVTGGASASDEWIELTNAGPSGVDLAGLEVVYVTSTGGTITRKATWTASQVLEPGRHLLLANAAGAFAPIADATYSGGLAATGGAVVVRPVGGTPIDAVGWGDAVNAFVEGLPAPAPAAGSSIARRPGGDGGNVDDTNDNAADWFVDAAPIPQPLSAAPVPSAPPSPVPSAAPSPSPSAAPSPSPSAAPSPSPSAAPSPSSDPVPSASPSADPSPPPSVTPSVEPSTAPSPSPTTEPSPSTIADPIADVRARADGSAAVIEGILTVPLGSVESGRGGFIEDATAGIALYLDADPGMDLGSGTLVRVAGTVDDRYSQRTLRISPADLVILGEAELAPPRVLATGEAGEASEGRRIQVTGEVVESPSQFADGLGLLIDDGSGPLRLIVSPAVISGLSVGRGDTVTATGPLGQRDSSGTGLSGYRVLVMVAGELTIAVPDPSPIPSSSPEPSPSPSPSPNPSPSPTTLDLIGLARSRPLGTVLHVQGVVTAEPGRLGTPPLVPLQDPSGAIVVRLPDDRPAVVRGTVLEVRGRLASAYGQLEIRPEASGVSVKGLALVPEPRALTAAELGEAVEAQLGVLEGRVTASPSRSTSGDLAIQVEDATGDPARVMVDASAGLAREAFVRGHVYRFTGVVGQRASRTGALDGYRLWLRDGADLLDVTPATSPAPTGSAAPAPDAAATSIAAALAAGDEAVLVQGVATTRTDLLDATGRRVVIEDATGAIEVLLPVAMDLRPGDGLRVLGTVGSAYGSPRLRASAVVRLARGAPPAPTTIASVPPAAMAWRLVRVQGRVVDVHRDGATWRAEIDHAGVRIAVVGLAGAAIPAARLAEGSMASIVGVVRLPYPSASDRRPAIAPRGTADVTVTGGSAGVGSTARPSAASNLLRVSAPEADPIRTAPASVDVAALRAAVGRTVRVGGIVVEVGTDAIRLDDGTGQVWVLLRDGATELLGVIRTDDAVVVIGTVEATADGPRLAVADPAGLRLLGALGPVSGDPGPTPAGIVAISEAGASPRSIAATERVSAVPAPLAVLPLAGLVGLAVVARRRQRERLRVRERVMARLTMLGRRSGRSPGPRPAEHGPRTGRTG